MVATIKSDLKSIHLCLKSNIKWKIIIIPNSEEKQNFFHSWAERHVIQPKPKK